MGRVLSDIVSRRNHEVKGLIGVVACCVALLFALMLMVPAQAHAATTAGLTITIGDKNGYTTLVNKSYTSSDGATVLQLLQSAQTACDIRSFTTYDSGYGVYPKKIVAADGTTYEAAVTTVNGYWNTSIAGAPSSYFTLGDTVTAGKVYQLRWVADYTTDAGMDWDTVYLVPGAFDESSYKALLGGITAASQSTSDPWLALELSAHGKRASVDRVALITSALAVFKDASSYTTDIEKYILALTACGIDATKVPDGTSTFNAIDLLSHCSFSTVNEMVFALIAYDCGAYAIPSGALLSRSDLLNAIMASQLSDGGFTYYGTESDSNMTAMVMSALSPYYCATSAAAAGISDALYLQVKSTVNSCIAVLEKLQAQDGGFVYSTSYASYGSDACSTAIVVVGLCSVGIDPQQDSRFLKMQTPTSSTSGTTINSVSPLEALMAFANTAKTGFTYGGADNDLATEQGYRALVAYEGYRAHAGAYNIYTEAARTSDPIDNTVTPSETIVSDAASSSVAANELPPTGDAAGTGAAVLLVLGMLAVTVGVVRHRSSAR